jgi:hypothetical protein
MNDKLIALSFVGLVSNLYLFWLILKYHKEISFLPGYKEQSLPFDLIVSIKKIQSAPFVQV